MEERKKVSFDLLGRKINYLMSRSDGEEEVFVEDAKKYSNFISKILKPNSIVIDIGARDGDSLIPLFGILNKKCTIVAFEPNDSESIYIEKNLELNGFNYDNFIIVKKALGPQDGKLDFVVDIKGRNGGLKNNNTKIGRWDEEIQVNSTTFESLPQSIKNVILEADFIKSDTEGSDLEVLRQLSKTIDRSRPYIQIEWWPFTEKDIADFCNIKKYIPFDFSNMQFRYSIDLNQRCHDLFLVPNEKVECFLNRLNSK